MKNRILLMALCLAEAMAAHAQSDWCGTDEHHRQMMLNNPEYRSRMQASESWEAQHGYQLPARTTADCNGLEIIPVVVHIITDNGSGDIPDEQVFKAIHDLNIDMRRLNSDTGQSHPEFKSYGAAMNLEFRLARIDPSGNATDGIVRVNSSLTNNATDAVKSVSYWPSNKYFNIWAVRSIQGSGGPGIVLGYAEFPGQSGYSNTFGVVIRNDYFGIGTRRTLTHEVGHCINLYHTFQSGCGNNCNSSGDRVCDTPPAATDTYGCDEAQNSCSNDLSGSSPFSGDMPDMIENYMSYDNCQNMFTIGQKTRALNALYNYSQLNTLIQPANLTATGVDILNSCTFTADRTVVCRGESIQYYDASQYGQCSWSWTFEDGNPASSVQQYPIVQYNDTGLKDVSLQVSNGQNTLNTQDQVLVVDPAGVYPPVQEGFESNNIPGNQWLVVNEDGLNKWERTSQTAYSGSRCAMLYNFSYASGNKDYLYSASYDLSPLQSATLSFKYAFAQRNTNNTDVMRVYISTDCGSSWYLRWAESDTSLATTNIKLTPWIPSDTNEWQSVNISLPGMFLVEGFLVRFEFTSGGGNQIYLDDININGTFKNYPILISPLDNETGVSDAPVLDWKSVPGVDQYEYSLDTSSGFNSPLLTTGTLNYLGSGPNLTDTEIPVSGLLHGSTYYWRVRTISASTPSSWSAVWSFIVSQSGVGTHEPITATQRLKLYPNPAHNQVTVIVPETMKGNGRLMLYDVTGQLLIRHAESEGAEMSGRIPLSGIVPGIYMIVYHEGDINLRSKLLIQ